MGTNEAPKKIYLIRNISTSTSLNTTNDCRDKYLQEWYKGREKDTDIEYVRTDAFIEKAVEFLSKEANLPLWEGYNGTFGCDRKLLIKNFRNYMEGE